MRVSPVASYQAIQRPIKARASKTPAPQAPVRFGSFAAFGISLGITAGVVWLIGGTIRVCNEVKDYKKRTRNKQLEETLDKMDKAVNARDFLFKDFKTERVSPNTLRIEGKITFGNETWRYEETIEKVTNKDIAALGGDKLHQVTVYKKYGERIKYTYWQRGSKLTGKRRLVYSQRDQEWIGKHVPTRFAKTMMAIQHVVNTELNTTSNYAKPINAFSTEPQLLD